MPDLIEVYEMLMEEKTHSTVKLTIDAPTQLYPEKIPAERGNVLSTQSALSKAIMKAWLASGGPSREYKAEVRIQLER